MVADNPKRNTNADLDRKVAEVDRTLQACKQRGLDPLELLRRAVTDHDQRQPSQENPR